MSSTPSRPIVNGFPRALNGLHGLNGSARRAASMTRDGPPGGPSLGAASVAEEEEREEDPVHLMLKNRWIESEPAIAALFGSDARAARRASPNSADQGSADALADSTHPVTTVVAPPKKAARQIDDDYGDDDDEDDEEDEVHEPAEKESPLKAKGKPALPNGLFTHTSSRALTTTTPVKVASLPNTVSTASDQAKSSEDVRKQLEQDKKAAAEAAKRTFQSMFFTLENDRDAMLEQQKLDELDREVENEISGGPNQTANAAPTSAGVTGGPIVTQGSLGSADLGASSLTLKHLIARIDMKRDMVKASDNQLRSLISEVRKGRSKWASEDRVGQEELYEAAEKVLMELKAMTEYAQPFLQRVSKREAPDYYNVIKSPMDIGTMIKKLKQLAYKSKKEFVDDLNLIWANCLKYNQDPAHPVRKKALYMRKETDKLAPLIPDIVVRDRAEVEAEERRQHALEADDSDDDDAPIMASRGRKAPKKGAGGSSSARKAPTTAAEEANGTPAPDPKPALHNATSNIRNEFLRADSETQDASSAGFNTPPPGITTPYGPNGVHASGAPGSQTDAMEIDVTGHSANHAIPDDADEDDAEFKTWKQVTMKDRAMAAAERNRLFRGDHLNADEPALLRNKAMMRRWVRQQKVNTTDGLAEDAEAEDHAGNAETTSGGETLAEGIETEEDSTLPDYYNPLSAIPDIPEHCKWTTDSEGYAVPHTDAYMRMFPKNVYKATQGSLSRKIEGNMRQMQETRKVCSKIGIVKQMQIQVQTYQNQFQKYEPQPFLEQDIGAVVVSETGPLMAPWVNRSALQRTVGKIFYHAGFEDFQPSALESVVDVASGYMVDLAKSFKRLHEQPRKESGAPRYTFEEQVSHTLDENGLDVEALETYVRDDIDRLSGKLAVVHERMKLHLADLLRPALGDHAGADGVGAFNDGSEQFVGGDFAEDLDEDFFGFRELGLAEEFGLESLSVPLHLLQNRMHSAYQAQHQGPTISTGLVFPSPPAFDRLSHDNLPGQIGLVQDFFRNRLRVNHDDPLVDDEELPQKQRFPKPRLPPTGKISSPRKRPLREQQQAAKKKRKLEETEEKAKLLSKPVGPLRLQMPEPQEPNMDPEKDADGNIAMISPESINDNKMLPPDPTASELASDEAIPKYNEHKSGEAKTEISA